MNVLDFAYLYLWRIDGIISDNIKHQCVVKNKNSEYNRNTQFLNT